MEIVINIYEGGRDSSVLQRLELSLTKLHEKVDRMGGQIADVNVLLDKLNTATNEVAADLDAQRAQIEALKAQIAAGSPVTQEQLDAVIGRLTPAVSRLEALGADPQNPIPVVENPPVPGTVG